MGLYQHYLFWYSIPPRYCQPCKLVDWQKSLNVIFEDIEDEDELEGGDEL